MKHRLHAFDSMVGKLIGALPGWIRPLMIALTFLGQPIFTGGVGALIVGIGIGRNMPSLTMAGIIAVMTLVIGSLLKLILKRDRPRTDYVEHMFLDTFSFPSGHAAGTVPNFGLLAFLAAETGAVWGLPLAGLIALAIFLIGISRVYLGAHYASDVLGGWIIGLLGLLAALYTLS